MKKTSCILSVIVLALALVACESNPLLGSWRGAPGTGGDSVFGELVTLYFTFDPASMTVRKGSFEEKTKVRYEKRDCGRWAVIAEGRPVLVLQAVDGNTLRFDTGLGIPITLRCQ